MENDEGVFFYRIFSPNDIYCYYRALEFTYYSLISSIILEQHYQEMVTIKISGMNEWIYIFDDNNWLESERSAFD